jgi:hypothetical protein
LRMAPSDTDSVSSWVTCGKKTPRSEVVFLCHVLILYTVIVVSIYNLTVESENSTLWTALLSNCLGYLLPNPTIKSKHVLSDITLSHFHGLLSRQHADSFHDKTSPNDEFRRIVGNTRTENLFLGLCLPPNLLRDLRAGILLVYITTCVVRGD